MSELIPGFNERKAQMAERQARIESEVSAIQANNDRYWELCRDIIVNTSDQTSELTPVTEKDGRQYDPLYGMYVDEFEDDPFGGDPYCPNNICCVCCGCDCE